MSIIERREFLQAAGAAGALGIMAACAHPRMATADDSSGSIPSQLVPGAVGPDGKYALPKLAYAYNALEAAIDAETMEIHHTKHHQGYVTGLNSALDKLAEARASGDFSLVEHWSKKVSFNAGGHFLHCIFWDCMGPESEAPQGDLATAISRDFGSHDAMWAQFAAAAKAVEGSGWARLSLDMPSRRLLVLQGQNQNLLSTFAEIPLLVLDVWEHAYYLRYRNKRADYVDSFAKVISWKRVTARYDLAMRSTESGSPA